jgi:hypothetical protein
MIFERFFYSDKIFWRAEFKSVGILEISLPVLELYANTFSFFYDNCTLLKTLIKTSNGPKVTFPKPLFEQKGPKQVPGIIFVRLKAIFSETAVKMASKSKKTWLKKCTFTGPTERFYFFEFFRWFCPLLGAPPRAP